MLIITRKIEKNIVILHIQKYVFILSRKVFIEGFS